MEKNEKEQIGEIEIEKSVPQSDPWSELLFGRELKSENKQEKEEKQKVEEDKENEKQDRFFSWI